MLMYTHIFSLILYDSSSQIRCGGSSLHFVILQGSYIHRLYLIKDIAQYVFGGSISKPN